jgi:hypothetical protein
MYRDIYSILLVYGLFSGCSNRPETVPMYQITERGGLSYLYFANAGQDTVRFHTDTYAGPALLLNDSLLPLSALSENRFSGTANGIDYGLEYAVADGQLSMKATCHNRSGGDLTDLQFSLQLGIDTKMESWPAWRSLYFPTLMRCEQTHFWGYLMNPDGGIITVASPDPVASYRLLYNNYQFDWPWEFGSGHLIHTVTLDLLNPPLPSLPRPLNTGELKKDETKTWTIYLGAVRELAEVIPVTSAIAGAPTVEADMYTVPEGGQISLKVYGKEKPEVTLVTPDGKRQALTLSKAPSGVFQTAFLPASGKGVYTVYAENRQGKISEAKLSVRYPWSEYIRSARRAALKYRQKASSNDESWLGLVSAFIAEEHFPDGEPDAQAEDLFHEIVPLMYDTITDLPTSWQHRIQNHAIAASLYVQRYKAGKDTDDLQAAVRLADFLITAQSPDGAYRSGKTHYTSVHYIAKSIMEVMAEEKKLATVSGEWGKSYDRHYRSVKKAIDELTLNLDNIQTEGELTFEDGMIACSCAQIAMFALLQPEGSPEREKYVKAAEYMYDSHRCLSQHVIPDSRIHGASLRFWEAQYDILTHPNMLNSPHGWSAWRIYGARYLYELTGREAYLGDIMNAMGSCAQLLNPETDRLNWAFVCDPYLRVKMFVEDEHRKGKGIRKDTVIGMQYMPMISDWYRAPESTRVSGYWGYDGGCCDNDVHEIFKCMGEIALTSAYFHLRPDGTYIAWNCTARKQDDRWTVFPSESCVQKIYANTDIIAANQATVEKIQTK